MQSPVSVVLTFALMIGSAQAQHMSVKIGVLTDGPSSVAAAKLAIADFSKNHPNVTVEMTPGLLQNKPQLDANIAIQMFDIDKVDMIVDVPNSDVALAVSKIAAEKNKVLIVSGAASSDLTGFACNRNTIHWTYDTWSLANGTVTAMVKAGGDTWFFLTADTAFGHALERDATAVVERNGGKVIGKVRHPFNAPDVRSFLLQARASNAKVIGLANSLRDTTNSIKQAGDILGNGQKLAGLLVLSRQVAALGLATSKGLSLTETWYWDANEANRSWSRRWQRERGITDQFPTMIHAGVYTGILHYLKARTAMGGSPDGRAITAQMKSMPTEDALFGKGMIDVTGRKQHGAYVFEVKRPSDSKYPGDFYKLKATISANDAFRDPKDSGCSLVRS